MVLGRQRWKVSRRRIRLPAKTADSLRFVSSMRLLRTLSVGLAFTVAFSLVVMDGRHAYAQEADQAEKAADAAGDRAEVASGLVDDAVANRESLEIELAIAIANVNDISALMSEIGSDLDTIAKQIVHADTEMAAIESAIEVRAVDAYMNALGAPALSFVNSDTVEDAMVAGVVVEEVVEADRESVNQLVAQKRELESLQADQLAKQEEYSSIRAEFDAQMEELTTLFDEADATVASRIREANAADAAYREALSAVEAARAKEAEKKRQDERDPPTTTTTPDTGGTPPTSPPTTVPATTAPPTTSDGGGGGNWDFPAAVEGWRDQVADYFPGSRVDQALRIIQCESLGDPNAYNPFSGASGLFQFLPSTWASTAPKAGFPDASPFDAEANIATAAWLANRYEELGQSYWQPWSCRRVL